MSPSQGAPSPQPPLSVVRWMIWTWSESYRTVGTCMLCLQMHWGRLPSWPRSCDRRRGSSWVSTCTSLFLRFWFFDFRLVLQGSYLRRRNLFVGLGCHCGRRINTLPLRGLIISWLPSPDTEEVAGEDWNGRDSRSPFIQYLGGGSPHCVSDGLTCKNDLERHYLAASESKPSLLVSLRKGLRMKFPSCSYATLYAAFETRLKQGSVTTSHSATSVSRTGHHWPILVYIVCFTLENVRYRNSIKWAVGTKLGSQCICYNPRTLRNF